MTVVVTGNIYGQIQAGSSDLLHMPAYFYLRTEDNGMTIEVDTDSFRQSWEKRSPGWKYHDATSACKSLGKPIDDVRYAELQARIQRLHESFDAWCGNTEERVFSPEAEDVPASNIKS